MDPRTTHLRGIRPDIPEATLNDSMSNDERFQNTTLRPIIKFQNDLIIEMFKNYVSKHKNAFYEFTVDQKLNYIENAIQKDVKFRNSLKGMLIGLFTIEEYTTYIKNSSSLNKRMMQLVITRLQSQVQLFELENQVLLH